MGHPRTLCLCILKGQLPPFISVFLRDRYFHVHLVSVLSAPYPRETEFHNDHVLSVTLFPVTVIAIENSVTSSVLTSLYVDEVALFYGCQSIDTIEQWLHCTLNRVSYSALENIFSFSSTKTHCTHFTYLWCSHSPHTLPE